MGEFIVGIDDPQSADVQALLSVHLSFADQHSPPEDVHALDIKELLADNVSFFSAGPLDRSVPEGSRRQGYS